MAVSPSPSPSTPEVSWVPNGRGRWQVRARHWRLVPKGGQLIPVEVGWDCLGGLRGLSWLPSGYVKIAIENGPVEIVDLPINSMVDLSIVMWLFTRGYLWLDNSLRNWIDDGDEDDDEHECVFGELGNSHTRSCQKKQSPPQTQQGAGTTTHSRPQQ